ncbi:MAG: hypothetical protein Q9M39_07965 [Sulfurovum sp.]|nr:hypothetical protein [Sulfurovum sp.]
MKVILITFLFIIFANASTQLKKLYIQSQATVYVAFSSAEFKQAVYLFENLFLGKIDTKSQVKLLESFGLRVVNIDENSIAITNEVKRGWGFYIIRNGASKHNLLSIPHRFFDLGTANIGYKFMREYPYKAIAFNTVHRKICDVAHTKYTLFNAFHLAFASVYQDDFIYQWHGFSKLNRKTEAEKKVKSIISTTTLPSKKTVNISECMNTLNYATRVFGKDIFVLGGTTNAQAIILKENGYHNFIHLELNKSFRDDLRSDKSLRNKIQRCLQ